MKDQLFAENESITVKQIKEKAQNMKMSWVKAHKLREQSGAGVRREDNVASFNALLEAKCASGALMRSGGHGRMLPL